VPTLQHHRDRLGGQSLKTSVELYTIWEMTGVLEVQLELIDENLFDVIEDIMDEKREDYEDWLEEQEEDDD
jgi:heterodisulfide reductase subunit C1